MKILGVLTLLLCSTFAFANPTRSILNEYKTECKNTEVTVDEIVKDSHIKGHITGLPVEAYEKFKVVFYVKTNRWYVHPYAGDQDGYSFSSINPDGEFEVKSVRRPVPSKQLAVVVVPSSYRVTAQKWWLKPLFGIFGGVTKNACNYTIVQGNGDFFM